MKMQVINRSKPTGGFRPLTADEIMAVSGGNDGDGGEGEEIVVTGVRPQPTLSLSLFISDGGGSYNPLVDLFAGFGGGGGGNQPTEVTVDSSCAGHAAANDPAIQAAALRTLNSSVGANVEFGFFAAENIFSSGFFAYPQFTSGGRNFIDGDVIVDNRPGFFESLFNGTFTPSLFVHGHQNNTPPSPVSGADQRLPTNKASPLQPLIVREP